MSLRRPLWPQTFAQPLTTPNSPQDRAQAKALFQTATGEPTPLALTIAAGAAGAPTLAGSARTFEPGQEPTVEAAATGGKAGRLLSKEEKERVRAAIEGAESVEEVS